MKKKIKSKLMNEPKIHKSVMVDEAVAALHIKNRALYIDATLGTGGHTDAILAKGGRVLGIDMDPEMIDLSRTRLKDKYKDEEYKLVTGNFGDLDVIAEKNDWMPVAGVLLDLGVSNLHLKDLKRGFSFSNPDAPLDMRLNPKAQGVTGADLLNALRRDQLEEMFKVTMEGGAARWLTKNILEYREDSVIKAVGDLLTLSEGIKTGKTKIHPATLPFLALRIAVNSELDNLKVVLPKAYSILEPGGYLAVITFHSGEDRIVKEFYAKVQKLKPTDYMLPDESEVAENPRARSARLRVVKKQ